jgi:hypothetical protein
VRDAEASALKALRSGFLYLSAAAAVLIAAAEFMPDAAIYVSHVAGMMGMVIFVSVLLSSVAAVFLYAVVGKIRRGVRLLSEVDSRFRICYAGTTLMLVGLAVLALGTAAAIALATVNAESGLALSVWVLLVGNTIAFTGYVLTFVVGAFKLYGKYRNPLYAAAGALFVLGIFLTPIVGPDAAAVSVGLGAAAVDYVLMYAALGGTVKKLNAQS